MNDNEPPEDQGHQEKIADSDSTTVPMSPVRGEPSGGVSTASPSADDFLRLAAALEALEPDQCSGHLYRTRCHLAAQLRKAQVKPEHPQNVALLRAALWLLRPSQDTLK